MANPNNRGALVASARQRAVSRNYTMGSAATYRNKRSRTNTETDRNQIAKAWQVEAYRHVNICGEARYAALLFANMAGRAEIGISEPQALGRKATWVEVNTAEDEIAALAEIAPTVRERSALIRDYMLHRTIAGECYLIARRRVDNDPGYIEPPEDPLTGQPYATWEDAIKADAEFIDVLDPEYDPDDWVTEDPNEPIWEIVSVMDLRKTGSTWSVRHDNDHYIELTKDDPVIRMWSPDPENRREAWSPFRSLLPTLREIEWETAHIFTQLRSRLMSAGVWFLPNNLTFGKPPTDSVEGGEEAIAAMNEAELFAFALADSSTAFLDPEEVAFPTVVMADPAALAEVDQQKLIQFWSEIDDKVMMLRSDAVRRFSLGMDLPPEQVLGSSGLAVTGAGGSAGSVNHWGVWANEEQTISAHIEPALDEFTGVLTISVLRIAVPGTDKVVAYDTTTLRLRQDRSKEAIELYDRGLLNGKVTVREVGFDPENDMMDPEEFKRWLLIKLASGSATPEMVHAAVTLLDVDLPPMVVSGNEPAKGRAGVGEPRNLDGHPVQGPPTEQHDHSDAPFNARAASCEGLVLRALEKAGSALLNDGKRGRERDRTTPKHHAHLVASVDRTYDRADFDFSTASVALGDLTAREMESLVRGLGDFCAGLYNRGEHYTRKAMIDTVKGL